MATSSRVKGDESGKPYIGTSISPANVITISQDNKHSAAIHGMRNIDTSGTILEVITGDERSDKDACRATSEVIYGKCDTLGQSAKHASFQKEIVNHTCCGEEDQRRASDDHMEESIGSAGREVNDDGVDTEIRILAKSRHRDGSIYRDMDVEWKMDYCIVDRNETRLEVMTLSRPTNCIIHKGTCLEHCPCRMLQILSLKLAKTPVDSGLIELYGYIAVRDNLDPLLNYIANFSRGDPIVVEQSSLISMAGPKRGIEMLDYTLIEYDMRVKTGQEES